MIGKGAGDDHRDGLGGLRDESPCGEDTSLKRAPVCNVNSEESSTVHNFIQTTGLRIEVYTRVLKDILRKAIFVTRWRARSLTQPSVGK